MPRKNRAAYVLKTREHRAHIREPSASPTPTPRPNPHRNSQSHAQTTLASIKITRSSTARTPHGYAALFTVRYSYVTTGVHTTQHHTSTRHAPEDISDQVHSTSCCLVSCVYSSSLVICRVSTFLCHAALPRASSSPTPPRAAGELCGLEQLSGYTAGHVDGAAGCPSASS